MPGCEEAQAMHLEYFLTSTPRYPHSRNFRNMIQQIQHAALYVHAEQDRKLLVEEILKGRIIPGIDDLAGKRLQVFSSDTLQYFISEELRHDRYQVDTGLSTSLANASSGEQRKALIKHILSTNPAGIILDDVYESLDVQT